MNLKKKVIFSVFWVFLFRLVNPYSNAEGASAIKQLTIDHAQDHKKAKKWAEEKYEAWKKKLSRNDILSLIKLLEPIYQKEEDNLDNLNYQLKVYGGDLSSRPIDTPDENKILETHVNRISRIINYHEGTLDKPLIVYKNETLEEIVHIPDESFRNKDDTLNATKVQQFRTDFSSGQYSEFRIYDLFDDSSQSSLIKWKIELPAGTPTGLIDEHQIVIDKDSAFKVEAIRIITQKGKQLIRIEAKLVPKRTVENEITQLTNNIHNDFIKRLKLPENKKYIDFKLMGSGSQYIATKLVGLMDKFMTNIDHEVIKKTVQFMSKKEGYMIFTDQKIYTLPEIYQPFERTLDEVIKKMEAIGNYHISGNRTLAVDVPMNLKINKNFEVDIMTLFHEFGHALDHYGGEMMNIGTQELSSSPIFKAIFKKEGKKLTKYGSQSAPEFFAEAFRMIHTPKENNIVKSKAPETYSIMVKILEIIRLPESTT